MLTTQEKAQVTQTITEIKTILEEVSANPDDYDFLKTAVEIYQLVLEGMTPDKYQHVQDYGALDSAADMREDSL